MFFCYLVVRREQITAGGGVDVVLVSDTQGLCLISVGQELEALVGHLSKRRVDSLLMLVPFRH